MSRGSAVSLESAEAGRAEPAAPAEQAILDAIGARDFRLALTLCAREHGRAVGRLCMALVGSQAEADDLVQETLLDAHDGFASYRADGSLRSWLYAIARRKCARHLERRSRQGSRLRLIHDAERQPSTEELVQARQRAERARAVLARIRPSEREAVVLRFAGELSYRELALACGIDEAAARKRVSRALAKLRAGVGDEE